MKSQLRGCFFVLLTALATGCAADHTLDDWRRDQLNEELSRLAPIAGTYRGTLTAPDSETPIAAMELRFTPKIRAIPGGPSEKASAQPVLSAKLLFDDRNQRLALASSDGFFDPQTGRFELTLQLRRKSGRMEEIAIGGSLQEDRLDGTLEVTGAGEAAGSFRLTRQAESSGSLAEVARKLQVKPWTSVPALAPGGELNGITRFSSGEERESRLVVLDPETQPEDAFLNRFAPLRVVQMTLNFGNSLKLVHEGAIWDERTRSLSGRSGEITSECLLDDAGLWHCRHLVAGLGETALSDFPGTPSSPAAGGPSRNDGTLIHQRRGEMDSADRSTTQVWMTLSRPSLRRAEDVTELFNAAPERYVTLALQFARTETAEENRVTILFERARLDLRAHTLDATTRVTGSGGIELTLHCKDLYAAEFGGPAAPAVGSPTCEYRSTELGRPLQIRLR